MRFLNGGGVFARRSSLALVLGWIAILTIGCGSSDQSFVSVQAAPDPGPTATVALRSELAQVAVPGAVDSFRATGYDEFSRLSFGPDTRAKSVEVVWSGVSTEVTDFVIEYLADGRVVGMAEVEVDLSPGQTFRIENPEYVGVSSSLESIVILPPLLTIASGTSGSFQAVGRFADGSRLDLTSKMEWSSTVPEVGGVEVGVVTGFAPGSTTIQASYAGFEASADVQVTDAVVESLELSRTLGTIHGIPIGTVERFEVLGRFSDGSDQILEDGLSWSSSDPEVASVNGGVILGLRTGQATIRVTFDGISADVGVTVTDAEIVRIVVFVAGPSPEALDPIPVGGRRDFVAIADFSDKFLRDITLVANWSCSEPSVANVSQGRARALRQGETFVIAEFGGLTSGWELLVTDVAQGVTGPVP